MAKNFQIKKIEIYKTNIQFKEKFIHAKKTRNSSKNIIIQIHSKNNVGYGESLPRKYVTGETPQTVVKSLEKKIIPHFQNLTFSSKKTLLKKLWIFRQTLKKNELSAFGAFELAILHLAAKEIDLTIEDIFKFFKIKPYKNKKLQYSGILGDNNTIISIIKSLALKKMGFSQIKIKTSSQTINKLKIISKILNKQQLRIDANSSLNLKDIIKNTKMLKRLNISQIEQPLKINSSELNQLSKYSKKNNFELIADEDLCDFSDLKKVIKNYQIINLRIGKVGGLMSSIYIYKIANENNIKIILGCLVGETILSRFNILLGQNLKTISNEGNYDKYLLKAPILDNQTFEKNGKYTKKEEKLNFKTKINHNLKKQMIEKITI